MAWIKTVGFDEADERLLQLLKAQQELYPVEYTQGPVAGADVPADAAQRTLNGPDSTGRKLPGIISSHTLIPDALYHAFSTFGVLMSADLPLTRRQHEMITTTVSVTNSCHY